MALSPKALTTLEAAKAALCVTTDAQDDAIEALIEAQSVRLAGLIGRELHYAVRTERVAGYGTPRLSLGVAPLRAIDTIAYSDGGFELEQSAYTYWIESSARAQVRRTLGHWTHTGLVSRGSFDPQGGQEALLWRVVYTAGWVTPAQATLALPRDLPEDLERATLTLITQRWSQGKAGQTVKSRSLIESSVTYADQTPGAGALPDEVRDVIRAYSWLGVA